MSLILTHRAISDDVYYWIDSSETARPLPDQDTAKFLSQGEGIIRLSTSEWESVKKVTEVMPSFAAAIPMRNGRDIFLLYNDVLYYMRSLGFLYKLAALNGVDFENKEIECWEGPDGEKWMQSLKLDDVKNHRTSAA